MKIDKSMQSVTTVSLNEGKRRNDVSASSSELPQANNVHLSSNATKLQNIEGDFTANSLVNSARVKEIKEAINEGNFQINPEAVADKLLETVRELIDSKKGVV